MATTMRISLIAAFLVALALASGCEDTPVGTASDAKITVLSSPSTVTFNGATDTRKLQSHVVATIVSADGVPQKGLTVYFTTNSGTLASSTDADGNPISPIPQKTDNNGAAKDTLTVGVTDQSTVTVTATSGTLSGTTSVLLTGTGVNHAPVATITTTPTTGEALPNAPVTFSGATSTDPDPGDSVASCSWNISPTPTDPNYNPHACVLNFLNGFPTAGDLTVSLVVTDTHGLQSPAANTTFHIRTALCANNAAPTAAFTAGTPVHSGTSFTVTMTDSSTASSPGTITAWAWDCGNSTTATIQNAVCTYAATSQNYNVKLTVTDDGDAGSGPNPDCVKTATVTHQITITPTSE